jgi:hypothetical protein
MKFKTVCTLVLSFGLVMTGPGSRRAAAAKREVEGKRQYRLGGEPTGGRPAFPLGRWSFATFPT